MDIPESILPLLSCDTCNNYLSCGPVYYYLVSQSIICGRCPPQDDVPIRCRHFEILANLFKFPCKNFTNGCNKKIIFSPDCQHPHEISCEYKVRLCPLQKNTSCNWSGKLNEILNHCRMQHSNYILSNPIRLTHDITKSKQKIYLISCFNVLFTLEVSICIDTGNIYHTVRYLGDFENAKNYKFTIKVERNNTKITKHGSVIPAEISNILEDKTIIFNIQNLTETLDGYIGTMFLITINEIKEQLGKTICQFCLKKIQNDTSICDECRNKVRLCRFTTLGCDFLDLLSDKVSKHESYFCDFITECLECGDTLQEEGLFNHYVGTHGAIQLNIESNLHISEGYAQFCIFMTQFSFEILCKYSLACGQLSFSVYTPFSSNKLSDYKCLIKVFDVNNDYCHTITPKIEYNYCHDWNININMLNFPLWRRNGLDVKIEIIKNT